MTPIEASQAIASTIEASWTGTALDRVVFDGQRASPGGDDPSLAWVRVTIVELTPGPATIGTAGDRLVVQRGLLIAQVFTPLEDADSALPAVELATTFRDLFHAQAIGADPIHFEPAAPRRIGVDGGWYQVNVSIPFAYHERI